MLIEFKVKNYKSFRDEAVLDLSATKASELQNHIIENGLGKTLKISAIYGANGSGKSNLFNAFRYMLFCIKNSGLFNNTDFPKIIKQSQPSPYYLDSKSRESPSEFEITFTVPNNNAILRYGFKIGSDKIHEEHLLSKAPTSRKFRTVFTRNEFCELQGFDKKTSEEIRINLSEKTLVLSLLNKREQLIYNWLASITFVDRSDMENEIPEYLFKYERNYVLNEKLTRFMSSLDPTICSVLDGYEKDVSGNTVFVPAIIQYKVKDSEKIFEMPVELEYGFNKTMLNLYDKINDVLKNGSVLFIDEIMTMFHTLNSRKVMDIFISNESEAQFIFTTMDTALMSNEILRRDEIWFTDSSSGKPSTLYSLINAAKTGSIIRKDESYAKNYLEGKYGGVPEQVNKK